MKPAHRRPQPPSLITLAVVCGSCDLTRPNLQDPRVGQMFCHGRPPTPILEVTVEVPRPGEPPTTVKRMTGYYTPVSRDSPGCAQHPIVREAIMDHYILGMKPKGWVRKP